MTPQSRLENFQRRTEWPMAAVALVFLALYSVQVLARPRGVSNGIVNAAMLATYLVFVADYAARLYLADPRFKWFIRNLLDLAIIVLPFLRPLRLLSLAVVIEVLQRAIGDNIRGKVMIYTALGVLVMIYAASLAILDLERDQPGTHIRNLGDAVWWSITTVTTVGYGDIYPVTSAGRLVAVALMIGGVSLLGIVTATLASWIVQRVAEEDNASAAATAAQIEELRDEIRKLTDAVTRGIEPAHGDAGDSRQINEP